MTWVLGLWQAGAENTKECGEGRRNKKVKDNIGIMMDFKCLNFKRGAKL
jgi:hypothetical protein